VSVSTVKEFSRENDETLHSTFMISIRRTTGEDSVAEKYFDECPTPTNWTLHFLPGEYPSDKSIPLNFVSGRGVRRDCVATEESYSQVGIFLKQFL
jgi:hypothetical protein